MFLFSWRHDGMQVELRHSIVVVKYASHHRSLADLKNMALYILILYMLYRALLKEVGWLLVLQLQHLKWRLQNLICFEGHVLESCINKSSLWRFDIYSNIFFWPSSELWCQMPKQTKNHQTAGHAETPWARGDGAVHAFGQRAVSWCTSGAGWFDVWVFDPEDGGNCYTKCLRSKSLVKMGSWKICPGVSWCFPYSIVWMFLSGLGWSWDIRISSN